MNVYKCWIAWEEYSMGKDTIFFLMLILFGQHGKHFFFVIIQCPAFVIVYTYIVDSFL